MKIWICALLSGCMLLGGVAIAPAQTPQDPNDQPPRPRMQRGQQGQQRGMQGPGQNQRRRIVPAAVAVFVAIDTDKDGELSKEEIEGATAALQKLDTDKDGKLTHEELMKALPEKMRRKGPGQGGPDGPPPRGGRGQGRGQGRGPGGQGPPPEEVQ